MKVQKLATGVDFFISNLTSHHYSHVIEALEKLSQEKEEPEIIKLMTKAGATAQQTAIVLARKIANKDAEKNGHSIGSPNHMDSVTRFTKSFTPHLSYAKNAWEKKETAVSV